MDPVRKETDARNAMINRAAFRDNLHFLIEHNLRLS
jgi:hypothetical protein